LTAPGAENAAIPIRLVTESGVVRVYGSTDQRLTAIAGQQYGRVARRQLLRAGITDDEISWRIRQRLLVPEHRGVYAVGHADPSPLAQATAALLTRGPGAMLAGHTAAALEALCRFDGPAHLLVEETAGNDPRGGIVFHRARKMPTPKWVHGLPLTPTELTIVMLATKLGARDLERALDEALARGLTTRDRVAAVLHPNLRGAGLLSSLLGERHVANRSHSEGQERMLQVLRDAGLPDPVGDADIGGGFTADFFWPDKRVAGEFDSRKWHSSKWARKRDARKDAHCARNGIEMIRATWDDLELPAVLHLVARFTRALA
jgi:hypothetical protein